MIDVALATDGSALDLYPDDRALRVALEERGLTTAVLPWPQESRDWSEARLVIPRGRPTHPSPELARGRDDWLGRVHEVSALANSLRLTRWNLHARYLQKLAGAGLRVADTACFGRGAEVDLGAERAARGAQVVVVAPAQRDAGPPATFGALDARKAQRALDATLAAGDARVTFDPPRGNRGRVRSLVYLDGGFSHAVVCADGTAATLDTVLPREDEIELARGVLAAAPGEPLYARLDLARDAEDRPVLVELDLVDGPLHFGWGTDSAARLAGSIFARLARG